MQSSCGHRSWPDLALVRGGVCCRKISALLGFVRQSSGVVADLLRRLETFFSMKKKPRITLPIKKPAKVDRQGPEWRFLIIYFVITLLITWGWQELFTQVTLRTIPYSQFKHYLALHEVTEASVKENEIDGRVVPKPHPATTAPSAEASPSASPIQEKPQKDETAPFFFRTERVEDPDLVRELQDAGVEYGAARPGFMSQLLGSWILPIAFIFIIWN